MEALPAPPSSNTSDKPVVVDTAIVTGRPQPDPRPPQEPSAEMEKIAEVTRHRRAVWAVPFLTAGMLITAGLLYAVVLDGSVPLDGPGHLTWWMLAVGFILSESMMVHLPAQRDSHTISMSEIPIVLGLAMAAPLAVIGSRVLAGLIVLTARRQPIIKLTFNLALFTLETTVALAVYRLIIGDSKPASPQGWLAAMAAIALAVTTSAALVDIVIALSDRARRLAEIIRSFAVGSLISIAVGFVATIAVVVLEHEPRAMVLLAVAMSFFFILFRAVGALSRRHDDLSSLYEFTTRLTGLWVAATSPW